MKKICLVIFLILILYPSCAYANEEVLSTQMDILNISTFIREGERFTSDVFPDLDGGELLSSAISGRVDSAGIFRAILNLVRRGDYFCCYSSSEVF